MRLKMATLFKVSDTCADSRERLPYHGGFHGKEFFHDESPADPEQKWAGRWG